MKIALYVEGQSEMIFVTDLLCKYFNFNPLKLGYICINLNADKFEETKGFKLGNVNSERFYQIVNVNNDNVVIHKIKNSLVDLVSKNFEVIIGLKDVFGDHYRNITKNKAIVDKTIIDKLYSSQLSQINVAPANVKLHFSIMEFEAWLLALLKLKSDMKSLPTEWNAVFQNVPIDVENIYHPTSLLIKLLNKVGLKYDKSEKITRTLLSNFSIQDYECLRLSGKCPAYTNFLNSILN